MDQCHWRMYIRDHRTSAFTWCLNTELKLWFSKAYFVPVKSSAIHLTRCACHFQIPEVRTGYMFFKGNLGQTKQNKKTTKSIFLFEWPRTYFLFLELNIIWLQIRLLKGVESQASFNLLHKIICFRPFLLSYHLRKLTKEVGTYWSASFQSNYLSVCVGVCVHVSTCVPVDGVSYKVRRWDPRMDTPIHIFIYMKSQGSFKHSNY